MNYLIAFLGSAFGVIAVYQIACGFPLILKIRQIKRQNDWTKREKIKKENEAKIKLLDKKLRGKGEVEMYVSLNRFNLPEDDEWQERLPEMIRDLLAIGWTTEMPIYSKFKYGFYEFHISTPKQDIIHKSIPIFHKYLDQSEGKMVKMTDHKK